MEPYKIQTISDLVRRSRPLAGAASLHHSPLSSSSSCPSTSSPTPPPVASSRPSSTQNPNSRPLTPLNHPAIVIGTLALPVHGSFASNTTASSTPPSCSGKHCFSFSDGTFSVCCDVLDLDLRMIGRTICVLAWNFIPFKCGNSGFLEIIRWSFPECSDALVRCSNFYTVPLISESPTSFPEGSSKARYSLHGMLESVSPISVVPCGVGISSTGNSNTTSGSPMNICGFLTEFRVCICKLCKAKDWSIDWSDHMGKEDAHSYSHSLFVYFCGSASSWHPAVSKLVGKVFSLSGLKKKLAVIEKESSQLMYITTEKSCLHMLRTPTKCLLPYKNSDSEVMGEFAMYTGVVRGVYMQGMVVELDEEVWLTLTDQLLVAPHSLRVGAIISVKNVHFFRPRFSWAKMMILGACSKTSFNIESYSPMCTGCYIFSLSPSLLGKLIESLAFSSKFWLLLVVTCLRKKFAGILSDKEILGSINTKGFAQAYVSSYLPSAAFRSKSGVFLEFCKHDSLSCCTEIDCDELNLAMPFSNFLVYCEEKWTKVQLKSKNYMTMSGYNPGSCEGRSCSQSIRRTMPSKELGITLLGILEISPFSGRLQLTDGTCSIDVVISGLPTTWNVNVLYEVKDYIIVIEGVPKGPMHIERPDYESFSCRNILQSVPVARDANLEVCVHFNWVDAVCRKSSGHLCENWKDNHNKLESGTFYLLCVTHKYPVIQKFLNKKVALERSSIFAEAILLPWNLFLSGKDKGAQPSNSSKDDSEEAIEYCTSSMCERHNKICKADLILNREPSSTMLGGSAFCKALCGNRNTSFDASMNYSLGGQSCCSDFPEIRCLATTKLGGENVSIGSGTLYYTKANAKGGIAARKVLLEFNPESLSTYQMLQIGGYYILKHQKEEGFRKTKTSDHLCNDKFSFTSRTCLWNFAFTSHNADSFCDHSLRVNNDEVLSSGSCQVELPVRSSIGVRPKISSYIHLQLYSDAHWFELDLEQVRALMKPSVPQAHRVSSCGSILTVPSYGSPDTQSLPEGNLVSLHGRVVAVRDSGCNSVDGLFSRGIARYDQCFESPKSNICIHVMVYNHIVKISGTFVKKAFPVGFGCGVTATFHRILESRQGDLSLIPVSFVVTDSINKVNDKYSEECPPMEFDSNVYNVATSDSVSSVFISRLSQCLKSKPLQLCCRVLAVHVVVLGKRRKPDGSQLKFHSISPVYIPLAGFILDDGTGLCCCWANAERAITLLRLKDKLKKKAIGSCYWRLYRSTKEKAYSSIELLANILEKHGKITVKNYGSVVDSLRHDYSFSVVSNNLLSCSDRDLLKLMIFDACFASVWKVIGRVMDSNDVAWLENQLAEMHSSLHSLPNFWATEVHFTDPLVEARRMSQGLLDSPAQV